MNNYNNNNWIYPGIFKQQNTFFFYSQVENDKYLYKIAKEGASSKLLESFL